MSDTSAQVQTSSVSSPLAKLSRMLRSMSRRWPNTSLLTTTEGFGVRRIDGSYLHIVYSGRWTDEDMRDLLALFATWLVADPDKLRPPTPTLDGVLLTGLRESAPSNGRQNSRSVNRVGAESDQPTPNAQVLPSGEYASGVLPRNPAEYGS